jgi:hypothetical protein
MPKVERNIVKPVNVPAREGARANNSFLPLAGGPPAVRPSNESAARGSSANLAELASPVKTPDHRFHVDDAKMAQPRAAIEPGKGAVPVNPFMPGGEGINWAYSVADSAKPKR